MTESADAFHQIIRRLAAAWSDNDADGAAALFREDAVYMQPPDQQVFVGRAELRAYFSPLAPGTYLDVHHGWFDEASGVGSIEFTFGTGGQPRATHGVAVIHLSDGLIAVWREYLAEGPSSFTDFTAVSGKQWRWHIGNYP